MSTRQDVVDISEPLKEICDRLGLPYNRIAMIVFKPGDLNANVFKTNDEGSLYVDPDTRAPAQETLTFNVQT